MDDALRRLERETRERPADLDLGRTYAEALRRAGERQRCFVELSRLSRHGDLDARREVTRWVPWPGTRGRGDTCWRGCEPLGATGLEYEVGALPSTPEGWSFLTVGDDRAILVSRPPLDTQEPMQLLQIDLRGGGLAAGWTVAIHGRDVVPFGDDVLVLDGRKLVMISGAHGHEIARRTLPGPEPHGLLLVVADLAIVPRSARSGYLYSAFPISDEKAGPAWELETQGHIVGGVRGQVLAQHRRDGDGRILLAGDFTGEADHVLEVRDPATGQVRATASGGWLEWNELLAWDDEGLLLSSSRLPRQLRAELDSTNCVLLEGNSGLADGGPRPVFAPDVLILLDGPAEPLVSLDQGLGVRLQARGRRSGEVVWSSPFWTSLSFPGQGSALAAADRTLYVAHGLTDELHLRGHDLASGAAALELRLPYGAALRDASGTNWSPYGPRLVQLAPVDGGLLILLASTSGPKLIRVR